MGRVTYNLFSGIAPQVPARSLATGVAQEAKNCDLSVPVELKPLRGTKFVRSLPTGSWGSVKTLYLYDREHWFTFYTDANVVRGTLPEDPHVRTYITDTQYPKVTRRDIALSASGSMPNLMYRLGVPAPATSPFVMAHGVGDEDADPYSTSYVQTYVTDWGEEGPPGPPSELIDVVPGQSVEVELVTPPSGGWRISSTRIYRLNTGTGGSQFQFVAERSLPSSIFMDGVPNEALGEPIPSETWYPPPDETHPTGPLQGMVALANGSLAGFTGNTVCVSIPYMPHAWPYEGRYTITDNIVALAVVPAGMLVLTDNGPYLMTGTSHQSMSFSKVPDAQACVSKRSVANMGGYVLYAGPEGMVACDGSSAPVVTKALFSEEEWRDRFNPESIHGYYWEGRYVGFYSAGSTNAGFVYEDRSGTATLSTIDLYARAGFYDSVSDQLYLNVNNSLVIFAHADEPYLPLRWTSNIHTSQLPTSYSAVRVVATRPGTLHVYADGNQVATINFPGDGYSIHRLPSGFRAKEWWVSLSGTCEVLQVDLSTSVLELRD